jgi:HEAT repeat protein
MEAARLAQLEADLRTGPVNKCKAALDALAQCPSEQAVPLLSRLATQGDFLRRRFAVMGLGHHRTEASFEALQALLEQEQDGNVLGEIANSLFDFGDRALPLLLQLFQTQESWITRQSIIGMLMEGNNDETLLAVAQLGLQDSQQSVVEAAILALGKLLKGEQFETALALLTPLIQSDNWRLRWRTATALGGSDRPGPQAALARLRQDPNHPVVAAALEGGLR